jgi:DNA-binding transcriptional LysR family regulator
MNITLKQLHVFCALYELRSFTAAARATFITQSAVSKLCTELESEVGQPLFERTTRSVTPCEGAADFYAYAQEILGTVRAAERSMSGLRKLERGTVGIATSPLMMIGLLGTIIADYHRAHPSVKLDLYELSTDDTIEYVRHGRADFGIAAIETPTDELAVRCVYRDSMYAVCAPDHVLARKQVVSWAEVAAHDQIMLRNVYSVRRVLERVSADLGLEFSYRIEAGMLASVLNFVTAGLGITVVPGYACGPAEQLGLRALRIVGGPQHDHELWLIQRPSTRLSLAAAAFLRDTEAHLLARQMEREERS